MQREKLYIAYVIINVQYLKNKYMSQCGVLKRETITENNVFGRFINVYIKTNKTFFISVLLIIVTEFTRSIFAN